MSGGKISFNASGLSFDIKTFNDYSNFKGIDNYGFNNINYEKMDYSDTQNVGVEEQVLDKIDLQKEEIETDKKNIINKKFFKEKFINTTVWASTKNVFKDSVSKLAGESFCSTFGGMFVIASLEGGYKSVLKGVGGDASMREWVSTFSSGFTKSILSSELKEKINVTSWKSFLKTKPFDKIVDEFDTIFEKEGFFKDTIEKVGFKEFAKQNPDIANPMLISHFKNLAGSLGMGIGIDYVASMGATLVKNLVEGKDINVKNMKPGSTFLKSSTKMICVTAGTLIGGKTGKIIGTAVGATIAEFQVAWLSEIDENGKSVANEKWCAIAGGAEIAGAIVGATVVIFLASNPVGWVVAGAMVLGAAVGYGVTCLIYYCWDDVCNFAEETFNLAKETISDIVVDAKEWVEDNVKANPVTNFLVGWAL